MASRLTATCSKAHAQPATAYRVAFSRAGSRSPMKTMTTSTTGRSHRDDHVECDTGDTAAGDPALPVRLRILRGHLLQPGLYRAAALLLRPAPDRPGSHGA